MTIPNPDIPYPDELDEYSPEDEPDTEEYDATPSRSSLEVDPVDQAEQEEEVELSEEEHP